MNITDILAQMGGTRSMAHELGVSESQASTGLQALLPAILGGLQRRAETPAEGSEGLDGVLGRLGGGGLLDNVLSPEPTDVGRGNDLLGHIFGSKDGSRAVANDAAGRTGLDPSILKKMLPFVAMMAAGYLSRQRGNVAGAGGGGLGGILGSLLGGRGLRP
jgi:hypothetical protein